MALGLGPVLMDTVVVSIIMENAVSNALKHGDPTGQWGLFFSGWAFFCLLLLLQRITVSAPELLIRNDIAKQKHPFLWLHSIYFPQGIKF